ncbi:MAG TPA: PLDc N-terminal domain-containing protein [Nitrosomonas sp.]|nr:PLDc N-terminal domain-containing protein [Nitrosomonas sp.]HQX12988.1 PLDc N-terminal domain-containing protein [Nitrosomonas sp.]HRB21158.1 PLDc N-terminal domain-containing protein [Nitrosomonas sp.]HRB32541.1 PLDc N-terminal domain-containing protein [Nitrosomonas sp.]HRB46206.1 PLDc N-terminal domain-containing protein [Nitrosomonas sp.]
MNLIGGAFGLIILALNVWAIANILTNTALRKAIKFMWIGIIVFLPVLGLILWFFLVGPKPSTLTNKN